MNYIQYKEMQIEQDYQMLKSLTGCDNLIKEGNSIRYQLKNGKSKALLSYVHNHITVNRANFIQDDLNFKHMKKQQKPQAQVVTFTNEGEDIQTVSTPYTTYRYKYLKKLAARMSKETGHKLFATTTGEIKLKDDYVPHAHKYGPSLARATANGFIMNDEKLPNGLTLNDYYTIDSDSSELLIYNIRDKNKLIADLEYNLNQKLEEVQIIKKSIDKLKDEITNE